MLVVSGSNNFDISDYQCLATCMLNRAFSQSEFQDVRKLAAELCGQIHPQLEAKMQFRTLLCSESERYYRPFFCGPCVDVDEVAKAQHGCIDCLALMSVRVARHKE